MPPKVYLYQPQIQGFRIAGEPGSKFYAPQHFSAYSNLPQKIGKPFESPYDKGKKQNNSSSKKMKSIFNR